jgi:hypothetical protein
MVRVTQCQDHRLECALRNKQTSASRSALTRDKSPAGGNIGFRAGSQQFTARNLQFTSCLTAISSIWNWSMTWKNILISYCYIGIDCSLIGGATDGSVPQGTGSIAVVGKCSVTFGTQP